MPQVKQETGFSLGLVDDEEDPSSINEEIKKLFVIFQNKLYKYYNYSVFIKIYKKL